MLAKECGMNNKKEDKAFAFRWWVLQISSSDQKTVKQLSKRDPKFAKAYKQFVKARSDLESSLRTNKGFYASI